MAPAGADWDALIAEIESFRGPKESDVSFAGRSGAGVKTVREWLKRKRWPRDTTLDGAKQRWAETRHLVDRDAPPRSPVQPRERQKAALSIAAGSKGPASATTPESSRQAAGHLPEAAPMTVEDYARKKFRGNEDLMVEWWSGSKDLADTLAKRAEGLSPDAKVRDP